MSTSTGSENTTQSTPKTEAEVKAYKRGFGRGFRRGEHKPPVDFAQGWKSLPGKLKTVYIVVVLFSLVYHVVSYSALPAVVNIGMYFNAASVPLNKIVFLVIAFGIQVGLVFFDITNRSVSKVKVFIPLIYFAAEMYLMSDLIAAAGV